MRDNIPVIGASASERAFHVFGFSAHGYQLGPVCGSIMADLIETGQTALPIEAFRADRFANYREALAS